MNAADTVAFARTRGYPTPAWLAWGTTPEGYPYVLYDYVEGEAHRVLGPPEAETYLALIERQIAMRPPSSVDWSGYIEASVLDDIRGDQARLRALGGPAAEALTAVTNIARGLHSPCLARDDLVHGDLSLSNLIFEAGEHRGVVDIEALGAGTAAYDLMAAVREACFNGVNADAIALLETGALAMFEAETIVMCVAIQVSEILNFILSRRPSSVQEGATRLLPWIAATDRLVGH